MTALKIWLVPLNQADYWKLEDLVRIAAYSRIFGIFECGIGFFGYYR